MKRVCLFVSASMIVGAIGCSKSAAPTAPSRAVETAAQAVAGPLFGASVVDFARCLQSTADSGCFAGARPQTRAVGAAAGAPGAPINLVTLSTGNTVTLTWGAPSSGDPVTTYLIEAGSSSGLANLANVTTNSTTTSFNASGVGNGTYFIRVRAQNASGASAASNESMLVVGSAACTSAPSAPAGFAIAVSGGTLTLTWSAPAGGCASSSYLLQAGSSAGSSELANSNVGGGTTYVASGVSAGTYFVRVRAVNAFGQSAASNEVTAVVTGGVPTPVPGGVSGTWTGLAPDGFVEDPPDSGESDMTFVLTQTGNNVTGTTVSRIRKCPGCSIDVGKSQTGVLTGTVSGSTFTFAIVIAAPIGNGPRPVNAVATGTFTSTRMTGVLSSPGPRAVVALNRQ